MKLIALVVVLFIERLWDQVARWRSQRLAERGFMRLYREMRGSLGASVTRWLILIPVPVLLWWGVGWDSGGLSGLLMGLIVLFVILAPRHAHEAAAELHRAYVEEQPERAAQLRAGLLVSTRIDPTNASRRMMAERIVVLGFDEWFAVLFWFVIAGPAGALLYRLADWLVQAESNARNDQSPTEAASPEMEQSGNEAVAESITGIPSRGTIPEYLRAILGWPAARVYAALLMVVGAFNRGLSAWIDDENAGYAQGACTPMEAGSLGLIARVGHAALDLEQDDRCGDDPVCLADEVSWYRPASAIVLRTLMAWLGIVALVTFAGWIN